MGKNKIERWAELETFSNVIQPEIKDVIGSDHPVKGNWRTNIFKNSNPIVLELACGKGEYTTSLADIFPEINFIGIDIKGSRLWRGAKTASMNRKQNVAFLRTRIEFLNSFFKEDEADEIRIIFPDPHPGKKNSNRRLTCPWFLNKYRSLLKDNSIVHLKTDNSELYSYTENIARTNGLEILMSTGDLYNDADAGQEFKNFFSKLDLPGNNETAAEKVLSIRTFYETRFLEEGRKINYLAFRLDKNKPVHEYWNTSG